MGFELTGLEGKVAVVTGAGRLRSIGRPCAIELARAGCDIVLTGTGRAPDRYPDDEKRVGWRDIESVADEVRALGRRCETFISDVRNPAAVDTLVKDVSSRFGRVDIVINNAGAARGADRVPVIDLEPDVWQNVLQTNLTGTFLMSREMARYNVRVNAICPGIIDTARMDDIDAIERGAAWQAMIRERIPLGRAGRGEDIAWITVFLCSDQGAWITGQSWNVDGGTVTAH